MKRRPLLPLLIVAAGCSLAPEPAPTDVVVELPGSYREAEALPGPYEPTRWWRGFGEPGLDRMVDTVLAANLDLAEAVGRVLESRAQVGIATADLLPSLVGAADVSRNSNPNNTGFGRQIASIIGGATGDTTGANEPGSGPPSRFENTTYSASLGLSYELDFWGRARNDRSAALRDLEASEADLQAVVLGVLSETITAWFETAELRERTVLTEEVVEVLEDRVALTQARYDRGLVTSFELYQVRQDLRNTQASLPLLRNQLADAEGRLAVLAGRYPGELEPLLDALELPQERLPPIPPALPADLLWQRPDVRAAGRRLEAARLRVGARRAELLPSLNLSGTLGLQSSEASEWMDLSQWFSNLAAGLTAPLFQGGRLRANVAAAHARLTQQTAAYGRSVLTAFVEVENALARLREEEARFAFFHAQRDEAQASVELQTSRYSAGVGGYADYLDALRNHLTVEGGVASAARDYALARLAVHRALGGDWMTAPTTDDAVTPEGS